MGAKISIDMELIVRDITEAIKRKIQPNKVVMIFGARRVGKTVLVQHLLNQISEPVLRMNGDDIHTHDRLAEQSCLNVTLSPGYPLVILMMAPFLLAEYSGRGLSAGPLTTSPEVLKTES